MMLPSTYQKLSRKERRAIEFGTQEQRKAVEEKYAPPKPFYVKEVDGVIRIPVIPDNAYHILPYMMPYAGIPATFKIGSFPRSEKPVASTPSDYYTMLSSWFFKGLTHFKPMLKPNVVSEGADTLRAFKVYVNTILRDWGMPQEHKMSYLTYVFCTCCIDCEWNDR